ncbi:hypothetical protein VL73_46 [Erwinia phage VL73]
MGSLVWNLQCLMLSVIKLMQDYKLRGNSWVRFLRIRKLLQLLLYCW